MLGFIMELPIELESSLIAGNLVNFVYLDPQGNESKDNQFTARCHFLPSIGEKVILGSNKQVSYVKNIYHSFLQVDEFEAGVFLQTVNVVLTSDAPLTRASELH